MPRAKLIAEIYQLIHLCAQVHCARKLSFALVDVHLRGVFRVTWWVLGVMELFDQLVNEAGQRQPTAMPVPEGMAGESWIAVFEHVVSTSDGKVLSHTCILHCSVVPPIAGVAHCIVSRSVRRRCLTWSCGDKSMD